VGAHTLSGLVKSCVLFIAIAIMSQYVFAFSVTSLGITNLILIFISLSLFSISTGILLLGLIFRYGTRIQALTWGLIFLFQPLTAAFFPVAVLPKWMQTISYAFPPTFVFEAARKNLETQNTQWELLIISFIENIVYFLITLLIFHYLFTKSKDSGQFARNES
jgi:ABC-2 type transport system permease protein